MSQLKIAIASRKGGVGKTTLTVALASILAMHGADVAILPANASPTGGESSPAGGAPSFVIAKTP